MVGCHTVYKLLLVHNSTSFKVFPDYYFFYDINQPSNASDHVLIIIIIKTVPSEDITFQQTQSENCCRKACVFKEIKALKLRNQEEYSYGVMCDIQFKLKMFLN